MPITVDDVPVTTGIEYCVARSGTRPAAWSPASTLAGKTGVLVAGPTIGPGTFTVWARITSTPEVVVLNCGRLTVA